MNARVNDPIKHLMRLDSDLAQAIENHEGERAAALIAERGFAVDAVVAAWKRGTVSRDGLDKVLGASTDHHKAGVVALDSMRGRLTTSRRNRRARRGYSDMAQVQRPSNDWTGGDAA